MKVACGENKDISKRFKAISISETNEAGISVEDLYSFSGTPKENIIEVLRNLKKKNLADHSDTGSRYSSVNFLIDEINQEILTKTYASKLAEGLERDFESSTVVIALQSVNKEREIKSFENPDGKNIIQIESMDTSPLENSGVRVLWLEKSVRMSYEIYELQSDLEKESQANPFITALKFKETIGKY